MQALHARRFPARAAVLLSARIDSVVTRAPAFKLQTNPASRPGALLQLRRWYSLNLQSIDAKWRTTWQELAAGEPTQRELVQSSNSTKYVLPMFPYPSGALHLGHLRVYSIADVVARYHGMKGHDVLLPMGWDAFGLPAENAALERGVPPARWTESNIAKMKEQLGIMNGSWDWSNVSTTADPCRVSR